MGYRSGGGAPTASVPLLPLPVRALRVSQGHVRAVSAAWLVAEGPGQAAREERARDQGQISPYVAVEVGNSTQGSSRRQEGGGGRRDDITTPLGAWPHVTGGGCCADETALFARFFVLEEMLVAYDAVLSLTMSLASLIFSPSVRAIVWPYRSPRQPRSLNWSGLGGRQVLQQQCTRRGMWACGR